jgi:hypothetical protein
LSVRELDRRLRRLEAAAPPRPAPGPPADVAEAIDAQIVALVQGLPDPDSPAWGPEHHAVLAHAAALHRRRWIQRTGAEHGYDLVADPVAVVEVARILREAGVG